MIIREHPLKNLQAAAILPADLVDVAELALFIIFWCYNCISDTCILYIF